MYTCLNSVQNGPMITLHYNLKIQQTKIAHIQCYKKNNTCRVHLYLHIGENPLKIANLFIKGTYMFSLQCPL